MGKRKYDGDMIIVKGGKFFYQKNITIQDLT